MIYNHLRKILIILWKVLYIVRRQNILDNRYKSLYRNDKKNLFCITSSTNRSGCADLKRNTYDVRPQETLAYGVLNA